MRYLFFDIECANCFNGKGKICSFGYCIIDEKFNLIEQKDLLINPRSKFFLGPESKNGGIKLAYSEEEFYAAPLFSEYYSVIKKLLEKEDQIVIGHSVGNDASFLLAECERYNLPPIEFKAYDTQAIHKYINGESNDISLEKMCLEFNIEIEKLHQSDWDAYYTMKALKAICYSQKLTINQLFEKYENAYIQIEKGNIKKYFLPPPPPEKVIAKLLKKQRVGICGKINPKIFGLTFCMAESFIKKDEKKALALARLIVKSGCYYTAKVSRSNYYILEQEEDKNLEKIKAINENKEKKKNIKIINSEQLLKVLNIDIERVLKEMEMF